MDSSDWKREDKFVRWIENEKQTLPKKSRKRLPRNANWWIVCAPKRGVLLLNQFLTQIQELQNEVNSLADARFCLRFPVNSAIPSPRTVPWPRFWIAAWYTECYGYFRKRWPPSALFENSKYLASSSRGLRPDIAGHTMEPERVMRREPQNSSTPVPRFQRGGGILNHIGGTYSHGGIMDYTKFPISEMHLRKLPDSIEFQSWKVNLKTEVCSKSADPHIKMHWTKEVEMAKVNRRTCDIAIDYKAKRFPWLWQASCDDCVCIEKAAQHACAFPKKSKCRRATCSKIRPILTRETNYLHDLRAFSCNQSLSSSARTLRFVQYPLTQCSDLFQHTLTQWRCSRFRRSMGPSSLISKRNTNGNGLGRKIQVKIAGFCSASDGLGFVRPRNFMKHRVIRDWWPL